MPDTYLIITFPTYLIKPDWILTKYIPLYPVAGTWIGEFFQNSALSTFLMVLPAISIISTEPVFPSHSSDKVWILTKSFDEYMLNMLSDITGSWKLVERLLIITANRSVSIPSGTEISDCGIGFKIDSIPG